MSIVSFLLALVFSCLWAGTDSTPTGWNLPDANAVVTGSTKGIGKAIVEELLEFGCRVVVCSRTKGDVETFVHRLGKQYGEGRVFGVACDVSTAEGRSALVNFANSTFGGRLDVLVNNVGTNIRKSTTSYTDDEASLVWRTNFQSAFEITRMCFPMMKRDPSKGESTSSVVMIGSVAGDANTCLSTVSAQILMMNMRARWLTLLPLYTPPSQFPGHSLRGEQVSPEQADAKLVVRVGFLRNSRELRLALVHLDAAGRSRVEGRSVQGRRGGEDADGEDRGTEGGRERRCVLVDACCGIRYGASYIG